MSRSGRKHQPPNRDRIKEKHRKLKHSNSMLRTLTNRQRRNLKDLVNIISQSKRALNNNDLVRALALLSANVKYPPSAAEDLNCHHDFEKEWVDRCKYCKEVNDG